MKSCENIPNPDNYRSLTGTIPNNKPEGDSRLRGNDK